MITFVRKRRTFAFSTALKFAFISLVWSHGLGKKHLIYLNRYFDFSSSVAIDCTRCRAKKLIFFSLTRLVSRFLDEVEEPLEKPVSENFKFVAEKKNWYYFFVGYLSNSRISFSFSISKHLRAISLHFFIRLSRFLITKISASPSLQ